MGRHRLRAVAQHLWPAARTPAGAQRQRGAIAVEGGRTLDAEEVAGHAEAYVRDGYAHIPSVVPESVCARAAAALWSDMGASPADANSWPAAGGYSGRIEAPAVLDAWSAGHLRLAEALASAMEGSEALAGVGLPPPSCLVRPVSTMAIHRLPERREPGREPGREPEWRWPTPHIDHNGDSWHSNPSPVRISSMTYFTDAATHGQGGTVVWPGSAARLAAVARRTAGSMAEVDRELKRVTADLQPVEVRPRAGDVLFCAMPPPISP